jgi:NAD(P)H dehydrogenase (quinone)
MMKNEMTIFGASGKVGIEVLRYFANTGVSCDAITRNPENIIPLPGINWLAGDLQDYQNVSPLVNGTQSLFLNTDFSADMAAIQSNLIREAVRARVKHIVYLSYGLMPDEMIQHSKSPVHQQHLQVEQALIGSGIAYTIIRPSGFMQSWLFELAPGIREEKKFFDATGEGKIPYIDTRDLAEVIAKALYVEPEKHWGKIYELTGSVAISFYDVANAISQAIGDTVTFIAESPEEARYRIIQKGYPEWAINLILYFSECQRKGLLEETTPVLSALLGRPSRAVSTFARDYATSFRKFD